MAYLSCRNSAAFSGCREVKVLSPAPGHEACLSFSPLLTTLRTMLSKTLIACLAASASLVNAQPSEQVGSSLRSLLTVSVQGERRCLKVFSASCSSHTR